MMNFDMDRMYKITGRELLALLSLIPDGEKEAKAIMENIGGRGPLKAEDTWGDAYVPHGGMERFKCPRCGGVHFKSYAQAAPADRSKTWTWEYVCAECGQGMGLTIEGDE